MEAPCSTVLLWNTVTPLFNHDEYKTEGMTGKSRRNIIARKESKTKDFVLKILK
jgi:hypothetical protein